MLYDKSNTDWRIRDDDDDDEFQVNQLFNCTKLDIEQMKSSSSQVKSLNDTFNWICGCVFTQ